MYLLECLGVQVDDSTTSARACAVLHNMCEQFGDYCLVDWEPINPDVTYISATW